MIIDENKWMSPMRIIKKRWNKYNSVFRPYVIKILINWTTGYNSESLGRDSKIMNTLNGYRKYREHLTKIRIIKIWKEEGDLQKKVRKMGSTGKRNQRKIRNKKKEE